MAINHLLSGQFQHKEFEYNHHTHVLKNYVKKLIQEIFLHTMFSFELPHLPSIWDIHKIYFAFSILPSMLGRWFQHMELP